MKNFSRRWVMMRFSQSEKQTLGVLSVYADHLNLYGAFTLELPWKDNKQNTSRIKAGRYLVTKRTSPKHKNHFQIHGVDGRDMILAHRGNYYFQTEGCVLTGSGFGDINKDGHQDVLNSDRTINALYDMMPDKFWLDIIDPAPEKEP